MDDIKRYSQDIMHKILKSPECFGCDGGSNGSSSSGGARRSW